MSRFLGTVWGADTLLGGGKSAHYTNQFRCTMVSESINKFVRDSIASNHGINGFFQGRLSSLANFSLKALHLSIAFSYLGDELTHPFRTPPKWFLGVHERQRQ